MRKEEIVSLLKELEKAEGFRIVGAVEVGGHLYGTCAETYRHDVCLTYVRPKEYYEANPKPEFSLRRDLAGGQVKIIGYEIEAFLKRLSQGIPEGLEWFASEQIYLTTPLWQRLRKKGDAFYNERMVIRHFYCMGKNMTEKYLARPVFLSHTYVIILHSLWRAKYVMENHAYPPTCLFWELFEKEFEGSEECREAIQTYVKDLVAQNLPNEIGPIEPIHDYVLKEVARQKEIKNALPYSKVKLPDLGSQYRETAIRELYGSEEGRGQKGVASKKKAARKHGKK